jgi:hypothetical protein
MAFSFEVRFQFFERTKTPMFEFLDPTIGDFKNRQGVQKVQFFPAVLAGRDEVCVLKNREMLGDGLTRHVVSFAKLAESLSVPLVQAVEQPTPYRVSKRFEDVVDAHAFQYATIWLPVKGEKIPSMNLASKGPNRVIERFGER